MVKYYYPHMIKFFSAAAMFGILNFIPIFAKSIGLSDSDIALVALFYAATMFVCNYLFGRLVDVHGRRPLIIIGLFLSAVSLLLYIFANNFTSFLALRIFTGVSISIQSVALIAYAHDKGHKLGRLSAFDALGIAFGSTLMGIIAMYFFLPTVFLISSVFFMTAFLISLRLERVEFTKTEGGPLFPHHIIKKNLPVYLAFFVRHAAANSIWIFWGLYLQQLGASLFWIGISMAINTLTQFFVMYKITDKMKSNVLITFGTILSAVTFFLYGIATNFWQILPIQIVLGTSWAFLYVGSIRWIVDNTHEKATGIGLLNSFINLSMLTGPLLATAAIYLGGGYKTIMFMAAGISLLSFVVFDVLRKTK